MGGASNDPSCLDNFRDKDEMMGKPRQRWAGAPTFVMAAIGSAIGLGNFWRFPYLCFKWGGGLFFIPYLISLFLLGLPMMILELSLGQLFQKGDIGVFAGVKPELFGVGLASVFSAFAINIFYTYLIAIACVYFIVSIFNPMLPWSLQKTKAFQDINCETRKMSDGTLMQRVEGLAQFDALFYKNNPKLECPLQQDCKPSEMYITEEYFMKDLLRTYVYRSDAADMYQSKGVCVPYETGEVIAGMKTGDSQFAWEICLGLLLTWTVTYFCVFKGVKSSSYVVWFTVPGPVIFIFIMVLNGLCLPNADEGIRMYLAGENYGKAPVVSEKLGNGQMWADACGQIFFSLGVCMGVMTSYASYNRRNKPIIRDVMLISFGNCLLSFYAGFAVFSIVGYLRWLGSPVAKKTSSSGLAFVAYPAAAELMPGTNFWTMILGLTLFTLGIDTAFSLVEAISTVVYDVSWGKKIPRKLTALIISVLGWGCSNLFASSWGYTYFDVVDRYISVYLMFVLGIFQCFGAGWMFRYHKLTATGTNKTSIMALTVIYWFATVVMGIVTIFVLPKQLAWIGILLFWIIIFCAVLLSLLLKSAETSLAKWYEEIFLYGAHELAKEIAIRHDELRNGETPWWQATFIFWWSFSVKYFIPWALFTLMMWNFKGDITMDPVTLRSYGNYHAFWQVMGFVYPFVGLLLFIVPVFMFWGDKQEDTDFNEEEDDVHKQIEDAHIASIRAQLGQVQKVNATPTMNLKTAGAKVVPDIDKMPDDVEA